MKKIISILMAFLMLSALMAVPFSAQAAGKYPNIDLSITSTRTDNGLPVGQSAKAPDAVFEVTCNDNNGVDWIVGSGSSTYWATSSGTKLTSSDTISMGNVYKLHLCVYPNEANSEDDVDINDVKQITFNGVPLTTSQYERGELGTSIYLTINFYYVKFTNASDNKSGFYCIGQEIPVTADTVAGKHFTSWAGTNYTGSGSQSVSFANATSKNTTFKVPYSSMPITVNATYKDHTPAPVDPVPATCTAEGKISGVKCSVCGEVLTAPTTVKALGHKLALKNAKTATYVEKGYTGDEYCTVCNMTISKGKELPKLILKAPKFTAKASKKQLKVTYKNAVGATGYQIKYIVGKKTYTKTYKSAKAASKVYKKLKTGKYKVCVRAFVKQGGKTAYSAWSKAKTVKVK